MKDSSVTMTSVALIYKNKTVPNDLKDTHMYEMFTSYFSLGTKKSRSNQSSNMMCPMEHILITQIGNKYTMNKGRKLENKNHKDAHNKLNHNG